MPDSGWNLGTLFLHFDARLSDMDRRYEERAQAQDHASALALDAHEKSVTAALNAAKEAVLKAENAVERRFEVLNGIRGTLSDQTATFVPRSEIDKMIQSSREKIDELRHRVDKQEGRGAGVAQLWGFVIAGISSVGVVTSIVIGLLRLNH